MDVRFRRAGVISHADCGKGGGHGKKKKAEPLNLSRIKSQKQAQSNLKALGKGN